MKITQQLKNLKKVSVQIPRILALTQKHAKLGTFAICALNVIVPIIQLGVAWIGKLILDEVTAPTIGPRIVQLVISEFGLIAAAVLAERLLQYFIHTTTFRLNIEISSSIMAKAQAMNLEDLEDADYYDRLNRARREASVRPISALQNICGMARTIVMLLGCSILLFQYNAWAFAAVLLAAIPAFISEAAFSAEAFALRRRRAEDVRKIDYLEHIAANDKFAKETKLFQLNTLISVRHREKLEFLNVEEAALVRRKLSWASCTTLIATGAFYTSYGLIAIEATTGRISIGEMGLCIALFREAQVSIQSLLHSINGVFEDALYTSFLFEFLSAECKTKRSPQIWTTKKESGIRFSNVGFKYPGRDTWALKDISFHISPGDSLAIVGENGSGKSTLVKLITGLYQPSEGYISIDGRNMTEYDSDVLAKRMSVVFQDYSQYQFTLGENVGIGRAGQASSGEIQTALKLAGADSIARSLPQGLDSQLGIWFTNGHELSSGQWQRIAIARALVRTDSNIFIFDEPTSALDAAAETDLYERLKVFAAGKTTVIISHRLSTARMAKHCTEIAELNSRGA